MWKKFYMDFYVEYIKGDTYKDYISKKRYIEMKIKRANAYKKSADKNFHLQNIIPITILEQAMYKRGEAGYNWFTTKLKIPFVEGLRWNEHKYNIQQYCNSYYVGKIVKASSIDKNGAYAWWLQQPLPHEEVGELEDDCATLYTSIKTGKSQWSEPLIAVKSFTKRYFKLRKLDGIEEFAKDYYKALSVDKTTTKGLIVSGVGYLTKLPCLIAQYIWNKQGEEITQIKNELQLQGATVLKIHTDSITWIHDDAININKYCTTYKVEYTNKELYMINAGLYQWNGSRPKGIKKLKNSMEIEYEDGDNRRIDEFPCLRYNVKYLCWYGGNLVYMYQGNELDGEKGIIRNE